MSASERGVRLAHEPTIGDVLRRVSHRGSVDMAAARGSALDMVSDGAGWLDGLFGGGDRKMPTTSEPPRLPEPDPDDPYGHAGRRVQPNYAREKWVDEFFRENPHVASTTAGRGDHPLNQMSGVSKDFAEELNRGATDGPRLGYGFQDDGTQVAHTHQPLWAPEDDEYAFDGETDFQRQQRLAVMDAGRLELARRDAGAYIRRFGL